VDFDVIKEQEMIRREVRQFAKSEIARVDGSQAATIAAGNSLGIGPLLAFGGEAQKKKYLPKLCTGNTIYRQNKVKMGGPYGKRCTPGE